MNEFFKKDLSRAIRQAISRLDKGTVGISADCLWQLTRVPPQFAPKGTNAAYVARQVFDEIVRTAPYNRFVYFP